MTLYTQSQLTFYYFFDHPFSFLFNCEGSDKSNFHPMMVSILRYILLTAVINLPCKAFHKLFQRNQKNVLLSDNKLESPLIDNNVNLDFKSSLVKDSNYVNSNDYINSLVLTNWGTFRNSTLGLKSAPSFAVISGKSGTGKSILLSAFEYLIKSSSSGSNSASSREIFSQFSNNNNEATISLTKSSSDYKRVFNLDSKKSQCYINNKKSTIKSFTPELPIRFWFRDSLKYLGSGEKGVINYIDSMITWNESSDIKINDIFQQWKESKKIIKQLEKLNNEKMKPTQTMHIDMLRHFIEEIDSLKMDLVALFKDISILLENFDYQDEATETTENDDKVIPTSQKSTLKHMLKTIQQTVTKSNEDNETDINLRHTWSLLLECDKLFNELSKSYYDIFPRSSDSTSGIVKNRGAGSKINGNSISTTKTSVYSQQHQQQNIKEFTTTSMIASIDRYLHLLESFQTKCLELGIIHDTSSSNNDNNDDGDDKSIFNIFETAYKSLYEAKTQLSITQSSLTEFQHQWPASLLSEVMVDIFNTKTSWESLAKKHNTYSNDLETVYIEWKTEIDRYDQLDSLLPRQYEIEKDLRLSYCTLASERTLLRMQQAKKLMSFINQLLPSLEMKDKQIIIKHQFYNLNIPNTNNNGCSSDNSALISVININDQTITFPNNNYNSPSKHSQQQSVTSIATTTEQVTLDNIIDAVSSSIEPSEGDEMARGFDDFSLQICHTTSGNNNNNNMCVLPIDTLSSGEKSRLALALETCCMHNDEHSISTNNSDDNMENDSNIITTEIDSRNSGASTTSIPSKNTNKPMLVVFDELDAHVGGDAAVAIARLLKRQGQFRQVLAVTHNPVIAAAADMHFLVDRYVSEPSFSSLSSFPIDLSYTKSSTNTNTNTNDSTSDTATAVDTPAVGSYIAEVQGDRRVQEIARMATGTMDMSQSIELARQLLDYDFTI